MPNSFSSVPGNTATQEPSAVQKMINPQAIHIPAGPPGTR